MNSRILAVTYSLALGLMLCGAAYGQQAPNETDLKAAYCLPVATKTVDMLAASLPAGNGTSQSADNVALAQELEGYRENARRLQNYLDSRSKDIDHAALRESAKQANEDFQRAQLDLASCATSGHLGETDPCVQASAAVGRVASCDTLSFLPF